MKSFFAVFCASLVVCLVAGCGKEDAPVPTSAPTPETTPAQETATGPSEADIAIANRSIDSIRSLIAEKQYQWAGEAIGRLEALPMTPAQRKTVNALKAQIPQ